MPDRTVFRGTAFSCDADDRVQALVDHLFVVEDGFITAVLPADDPAAAEAVGDAEAVSTQSGQYWLPGFVDLHVHAPQWAQAGTALDLPLADWLRQHTFPLEARFADVDFARRVYASLVAELLARGTTTALYFATVHPTSSLELVLACAAAGQRGLVGKVVMDGPDNPDFYKDADASAAVADTGWFIRRVQELRAATGAEVYPVITPRFIPSCTDEALAGLGALARDLGVHVQSHCAESDWESSHVRERTGRSDSAALDGFGLLGERSVLAHCVHLDDDDVALFASTGTAVAHCPLSNAFFGDAVAPVRRYARAGVDVGLGTDISGGFDPSLWSAIRQTVTSSRMLESGVDAAQPPAARGVPDSRVTFEQAFALATAGGGRSLSLPIGRLAEGYAWDAQLIDVVGHRPLPIFDDDEPERILERIITLATPANIRAVWVQGRKVVADGEVVVGP